MSQSFIKQIYILFNLFISIQIAILLYHFLSDKLITICDTFDLI